MNGQRMKKIDIWCYMMFYVIANACKCHVHLSSIYSVPSCGRIFSLQFFRIWGGEVHRCLVAGPKKFHVFPQSSHRRTTSLPNDGDFQGKLKLFRAGSNKLKQNPPTPAFAKAGAAPGTTAGVKLFSAAASTKASGRQPLLPPSSWPSALQHCSLPFIPAHSPLLLRHSSLPLASLQTLKTPKTLRGSFHQALWPSPRHLPPSPLAVSLCCSRVAACPLPAHPSRQLPPSSWPSALQHCSLPFTP